MPVTARCDYCKKVFTAKKRTGRTIRFCSTEHYHAVRRERVATPECNTECSTCGVGLYRAAWQMSKFERFFCSRRCRGMFGSAITAKMHSHPVGYRLPQKPSGYVLIRTPSGWVPEHRYVMEMMLGRQLHPGESVHHKNGDRADNRATNLELWVTAQPSGQRPEDLLAFAYEIIARYQGQSGTTGPRAVQPAVFAAAVIELRPGS